MQADKLSGNAPGNPKQAHESHPVKADIPHDEIARKQNDVQKQSPVPTQIKQGNTVTLTQGGVDRDNTTRYISHEGAQPSKAHAEDQAGLTGGLDAVEVPEGLGAK